MQLRFKKLPLAYLLGFFLALLLPSASLAQLVSQGNEQVVPYSGTTAFILTQAPVNPNLLTGTGTNTFILNVNPTTNAVRLYLVNDTANACANISVSMASTGNNSLNSFNNNVSAWQSVNVQTGTGGFASTAAVTIPASGTIAITSQPIIGGKLAIFVVLSSGCLTTTIDAQAVFGTFTPAIGAVQGIVATGQPGAGVNPLLVGGIDVSNNARPLKLCQDSGGVACAGGGGYTVPIGAGGNTIGSEYSVGSANLTSPNAASGPLAVFIGTTISNAALGATSLAATGGNSSLGSTAANAPGLFETRSGVFFKQTGASVTATTTVSITGTAQYVGSFTSCHVAIEATLVSGTTPTLNAFLQDSFDGATWTDRWSMTQLTATGNQWGGISGSVGANSTAFTNGTLAQTTKVDGPIAPFLRLQLVAGGTTPSWTVTSGVNCY